MVDAQAEDCLAAWPGTWPYQVKSDPTARAAWLDKACNCMIELAKYEANEPNRVVGHVLTRSAQEAFTTKAKSALMQAIIACQEAPTSSRSSTRELSFGVCRPTGHCDL